MVRSSEKGARISRYVAVAEQKRQQALRTLDSASREVYYTGLLIRSQRRTDTAAQKDRKQINKDLPRTFRALPAIEGAGGEEALLPLLWHILVAYIERGRTMSATSLAMRNMQIGHSGGAATTARGILEGYPQGLNFVAGLSLLSAGGECWDGSNPATLEEIAFWLLSLLLEDVLDPDFFGADVKDNLKMAYVGGLGMRDIVIELAEPRCPSIFAALGHEAFASCLSSVLDQWLLSLFVGCAPPRLLEHLWDHLLLPSPYHPETDNKRLPRGLVTIVGFALAFLKSCGEDALKHSRILEQLSHMRAAGASPEDLSLEAAEAIQGIPKRLASWPLDEDAILLTTATQIVVELVGDGDGFSRVWDNVRKRKQRIVSCTDNYDEQLMSLVQRTHFTMGELDHLRAELERLRDGRRRSRVSRSSVSAEEGLSLEGFTEVVSRTVPEFPPDLCGRLFKKLDAFNVGRLTFAELACGMSALSLGTMDEKLQVCFDLFDSEGQRALTLKDMGELCTVLFRVALAQGFTAAKKPSTDELLMRGRSAEEILASDYVDVRSARSCALARSYSLSEQTHKDDAALFMIPAPPAEAPWRSMLLRLLSAAHRSPNGPWLVAFEDFRNAAHMEPALLCLFSWCLPRPPEIQSPSFTMDLSMSKYADKPNAASGDAGLCGRVCAWFARLCDRGR